MPNCISGEPDYTALNLAIKTIVRLHLDEKIKLKDADKGDRAALKTALSILAKSFPEGVQ